MKKVKNIVAWSYDINDLNDEETVGTFYEKESQKKKKKKKKKPQKRKKKINYM